MPGLEKAQIGTERSEIMDAVDVAAYFKVSRRTAARWMESGKLPAFRLGAKWLTRRDALDEVTRQHLTASA